jgi:antitoxin CcdA
MRMNAGAKIRTKPTNVSLDAALVVEAKALGVSISQASNRGLEEAVKKARAEAWLEENRAALDSYNTWVEAHGLPLEKYRLF